MTTLAEILAQPRFQEIQSVCRAAASPDPAHDFSHCLRVLANAYALWKTEGGDLEVLAAASFLHDMANLPKNHPDSKKSSSMSAEKAGALLSSLGFSAGQVEKVKDAILCHSFSRGLTPQTTEGRVFQDADRLDALGAIGIARTFAVGGATQRPLYWHEDPFCSQGRTPCDKPDNSNPTLSLTANTLDHFYLKLLNLEKTFLTAAGRSLAKQRTEYIRKFLDQLSLELSL